MGGVGSAAARTLLGQRIEGKGATLHATLPDLHELLRTGLIVLVLGGGAVAAYRRWRQILRP